LSLFVQFDAITENPKELQQGKRPSYLKKKEKQKLAGRVPIAAASVNRAEVVFHFQQLYIY